MQKRKTSKNFPWIAICVWFLVSALAPHQYMCFTSVRPVFLVGSGCGLQRRGAGSAAPCWPHAWVGGCRCRGGAGASWAQRHLALSKTVSELRRLTPNRKFGVIWPLETGSLRMIFLPCHFLEAHFSLGWCSTGDQPHLETVSTQLLPFPSFS